MPRRLQTVCAMLTPEKRAQIYREASAREEAEHRAAQAQAEEAERRAAEQQLRAEAEEAEHRAAEQQLRAEAVDRILIGQMRNRAGFVEQQLQAETAMKEGRFFEPAPSATFSLSDSDEDSTGECAGPAAQGGGSGESVIVISDESAGAEAQGGGSGESVIVISDDE